ncbi:hypothetical protein [Argonema antarcticum]|uniref:hypothetical protein n=1 Tax=Argonema antarcticum TaxID=2942763 RepID=UPI0020128361|nr:hypothetical protein [Argonema antarcticum]MCL1475693.1 hypothetical protein [Argonema antarcticum A004/B2]
MSSFISIDTPAKQGDRGVSAQLKPLYARLTWLAAQSRVVPVVQDVQKFPPFTRTVEFSLILENI